MNNAEIIKEQMGKMQESNLKIIKMKLEIIDKKIDSLMISAVVFFVALGIINIIVVLTLK